MYFTSGRIKKCERCVDPTLAAELPKLVQHRMEIEAERKAELDVGWYPEPFRSTWKEIYAGFNIRRRLLFEATIADRRRTDLYMMQTTDIVNRVPEDELDIEIGMFTPKRVAAARSRLAELLEKERRSK